MTDSEIVKALECCGDTSLGHCENCPLNDDMGFVCIIDKSQEALDLINRQKAEIKRLKSKVEPKGFKTADPMDFCGVLCDFAEGLIAKAKAEAYKEFWNSRPERLNEQCEGKEEYNKGWNACLDEFWDIRNNLFEELVGDSNES